MLILNKYHKLNQTKNQNLKKIKLLRPHKELNNNLTNQLQIINLNNGKPKKDLKYILKN